jgi:hypothetical protein
VQERKQKLLSRNLESVFCLSISKLQGEARKLDSAWRYLDLEICPGSKIRGEARNLDSGWPAPGLGSLSRHESALLPVAAELAHLRLAKRAYTPGMLRAAPLPEETSCHLDDVRLLLLPEAGGPMGGLER